jgi:hypothetical protein
VSSGKIVPSDMATEFRNESSRDRTLDDESIKDFWAYHFPRRGESTASKEKNGAGAGKLLPLVATLVMAKRRR